MKSCYISMQHYAAVNHICNALKHNAEVEVYGENKKGEMPKKENARAYFLAFDDVADTVGITSAESIGELDSGKRTEKLYDLVLRTDDLRNESAGAVHGVDDVFGTFVCDDLSLVYDDDAVAYRLNLGQNVRRKNDGMILAEVLDEVAYLNDLLRVETDGRLVENKHLRVADERLRNADTLTVAL